jgi:anti-sigma B factor antagonist
MSHDPADPELSITLAEDGDRAVLYVRGEIDLLTAPEFEQALTAALERHARVLVDLCDVTFMDSTGLRVMLHARRALEGSPGRIAVRAEPGGPAARLLELAGVTGLFPSE